MKYAQLTSDERYTIARLRMKRFSVTQIADCLGRHRSTIYRELSRNRSPLDGKYRAQRAGENTRGRRSRSRRNSQFDTRTWRLVEGLLKLKFSPEQIAGTLMRSHRLRMSHETIYRRIWRDKKLGGRLYKHLRQASKQKRKRYRARDSRGRLAGKRSIDQRPESINNRWFFGHWEIDTVMGRFRTKPCILMLVERKTGQLLIGKLKARTVEETNRCLLELMSREGFHRFKSITADNGTEFHGFEQIERATGTLFYFAHPYHSWERGSNENANGLIRQYLPKGKSMVRLTQKRCDEIADKLNHRPRKRYGFKTPEQLYRSFQ